MIVAAMGSITGEGRVPITLQACLTDAAMHLYLNEEVPAFRIGATDLTSAQLLTRLAPSCTVHDLHREPGRLLGLRDVLLHALAGITRATIRFTSFPFTGVTHYSPSRATQEGLSRWVIHLGNGEYAASLPGVQEQSASLITRTQTSPPEDPPIPTNFHPSGTYQSPVASLDDFGDAGWGGFPTGPGSRVHSTQHSGPVQGEAPTGAPLDAE